MNKKIKDNHSVTILGIKIDGGVLVAIIIFVLFLSSTVSVQYILNIS